MLNMFGRRFVINSAFSKWTRSAVPIRQLYIRSVCSRAAKRSYLMPRMIVSTNVRTFCQAKSDSQAVEYIEAKVFEVLKAAAKCDHSKLCRSATFQDLGFDSLDEVEVIVAMEEHIGIDLSNGDAELIKGVLDCIQVFYDYYTKKNQPVKESEDQEEEKAKS